MRPTIGYLITTISSSYFCKEKKYNYKNAKYFVDSKYKEISDETNIIVSRLSKSANNLIIDVDNNICEQFNSLINKFLGGKRINFTQKSSYTTRVQAAVISFNSKEYLRTIKKYVSQTSPGIYKII